MSFTRFVISVGFLFLSASLLADQKEKILVCHVGSDTGSLDETYTDNPDCTPPENWEGEFRCSDAGKIDLILASAKAKHIGNENHAFDGMSDYAPVKDGAGSDPADFEDATTPPDGIDDGCEVEELLECPCWDSYTLTSLNAQLDDWYAQDELGIVDVPRCYSDFAGCEGCFESEISWRPSASTIAGIFASTYSGPGPDPVCILARELYTGTGAEAPFVDVTQEDAVACVTELDQLLPLVDACEQAP